MKKEIRKYFFPYQIVSKFSCNSKYPFYQKGNCSLTFPVHSVTNQTLLRTKIQIKQLLCLIWQYAGFGILNAQCMSRKSEIIKVSGFCLVIFQHNSKCISYLSDLLQHKGSKFMKYWVALIILIILVLMRNAGTMEDV